MTSLERCIKTLDHGIPDRLAVVPQDSHMAAKLGGVNFIDWAYDPDKRAKAILEQRERFDFDGVMLCGETTILAEAAGAKVEFSKEECPRWKAGCIDDYAQVKDMAVVDPAKDGRLNVWVETTKQVVNAIGRDYLVISRADQGAFSMASMLRGMESFMMDIALAEDDPELKEQIHSLLRYCNKCQFAFIKALKAVGAPVTTTGDSIAGPSVCAPKHYYEYCLPYEKEITQWCKEIGIKFSIHICGSAEPILDHWMEAGMDMIEIDHKTDFVAAKKVTKGKCTILGNIDTTLMYLGDYNAVFKAVKDLIGRNKPEAELIVSSGCMLSKNTPSNNVKAMVDATREFGVFA
jgi:uroporphyrinogen decarboxylase